MSGSRALRRSVLCQKAHFGLTGVGAKCPPRICRRANLYCSARKYAQSRPVVACLFHDIGFFWEIAKTVTSSIPTGAKQNYRAVRLTRP